MVQLKSLDRFKRVLVRHYGLVTFLDLDKYRYVCEPVVNRLCMEIVICFLGSKMGNRLVTMH